MGVLPFCLSCLPACVCGHAQCAATHSYSIDPAYQDNRRIMPFEAARPGFFSSRPTPLPEVPRRQQRATFVSHCPYSAVCGQYVDGANDAHDRHRCSGCTADARDKAHYALSRASAVQPLHRWRSCVSLAPSTCWPQTAAHGQCGLAQGNAQLAR